MMQNFSKLVYNDVDFSRTQNITMDLFRRKNSQHSHVIWCKIHLLISFSTRNVGSLLLALHLRALKLNKHWRCQRKYYIGNLKHSKITNKCNEILLECKISQYIKRNCLNKQMGAYHQCY